MNVKRIEDVASAVVATLQRVPSGLFTDIDGTISHVVASPGEAKIIESAREALRRIAERITIVGVVTGRSAIDAAGMLELEGAIVIGNHGYERIQNGERWIHPSAISSRAEVAAAAESIASIVATSPLLDGVIVENKDLSASVHYRQAQSRERVDELLRRLVPAIADLHDLTVTEGKLVLELRPKATIDKGTAIRDIAAELGLRGIVYLGDDLTDVDAFRALHTFDASVATTLSVGIVSEETHESVREAADVLVNGVQECAMLLREVAERI